VKEQQVLMRIAPHLVHPLPVLIPTYGHWLQGKEAFALALLANHWISFDRDRLVRSQSCLPRGRVISKSEVLQLAPGIRQQGLTGGAIFYDAQMSNSERLIFAFLRSAEQAGAQLANYTEVRGLIKEKDTVIGVEASDTLTGNQLQIRAKTVVNTCGPWVSSILDSLRGRATKESNGQVLFAKAMNVLTRPFFPRHAVGVSGKNRYNDTDAVLNKGNRLLFITPWRGFSLIGTAQIAYDGKPEDCKASDEEIENFLREVNQAYPAADLKREDIVFVHSGLLPSSGISHTTGDVQVAKHYQIHDHRSEGFKGILSVVGVKYTTARRVAEKVVDQVFESWGHKPSQSASSYTPLHGGRIEQFDLFLRAHVKDRPPSLSEEAMSHLVGNYGSAYQDVLQYLDAPRCSTSGDRCPVLRAEVLHGIRDEMAQKLSDVVFRRTDLGTTGHPGDEALNICAEVMSRELAWAPSRTLQELQDVNKIFSMRQ
jgi:glycerol-3-phosphate dehydrogenase